MYKQCTNTLVEAIHYNTYSSNNKLVETPVSCNRKDWTDEGGKASPTLGNWISIVMALIKVPT